MKKCLALLLSLTLLTGCLGTLVPKKVEFLQDKVALVPEPTSREKELQKQVAQRAHEKAQETYVAALTNHCVPQVVSPAADTVILTESVSRSVGPPVSPASVTKPARDLAAELDTAIAKLDRRLDEFKEDNNHNAGKKIEGTGLFQIPYFVWLLICAALAFLALLFIGFLWTAVKLYSLSNPPVALGLNAIQTGAGFAKRALSEVIKGGQEFKQAVQDRFDDPETQAEILELFRLHQERSQSVDTQNLIKELKK